MQEKSWDLGFTVGEVGGSEKRGVHGLSPGDTPVSALGLLPGTGAVAGSALYWEV